MKYMVFNLFITCLGGLRRARKAPPKQMHDINGRQERGEANIFAQKGANDRARETRAPVLPYLGATVSRAFTRYCFINCLIVL